MRRLAVVLTAFAISAAACGGTDEAAVDNPPDSSAPSVGGDGCSDLEATDVGITATEIRIAAIADTGSPLAPGLFETSIAGTQAWAEVQNARGGLACRQIVVETYDSKLNAIEANASVVKACGSEFAMVGTTALFLNSIEDLEGCRDADGTATGIPDIAVIQTEALHQCSPVSFAVIPFAGLCPYSGEGERDFLLNAGPARWALENISPDLHGPFLIPSDLPSTIASTIIQVRGWEQAGIGNDGEFGVSSRAAQSEYTSYVQAIIDNDSNYAQATGSVDSTLFFRKEAQVQGIEGVTWMCLLQCYDTKLLTQGGEAVEGTYVSIDFVPFEEAAQNEELAAFIGAVDRPDAFGLKAYLSGLLLGEVIEAIVERDGVNGVTRAKVLEGIAATTSFDGRGIVAPINVGEKRPGQCFTMLQVRNGEFVRVHPGEPAAFDCSDANLEAFTVDASSEFTG